MAEQPKTADGVKAFVEEFDMGYHPTLDTTDVEYAA